jgi:hypothetical protein
VLGRRSQDDLVDGAVRSGVWEGCRFTNAVPVIVHFVTGLAIALDLGIGEQQDTGAGGVNQVSFLSILLLRETGDNCTGGGFMVAVCGVQDDVCLCGFRGEELEAVEIAVDEADLGVLGSYLCAFVAVADDGCDLEVRVGVCNGVEGVAADVACSSRAEMKLGFKGLIPWTNLSSCGK